MNKSILWAFAAWLAVNAPAGDNMVINSGFEEFENGSFKGWVAGQRLVTAEIKASIDDKSEGKQSAKIKMIAMKEPSDSRQNAGVMTEYMNVVQGMSLKYSFMLKTINVRFSPETGQLE